MHSEDTQRIADWMRELAVDPSLRPLEDSDLIWAKAQLSDRRDAVARAFRPIAWCDTIISGLVGFVACWLVLGWAHSLLISAEGIVSPTLLSLAASLVVAAVIGIAYPMLIDE